MSEIVLFQNKMMNKDEIAISPDDRGYYFGDGIYEVFRIYKGKLFEAESHMERFMRSAAGIQMELPDTPTHILARLYDLLRESGVIEGTLYMQMTRGTAPRSHLFPTKSEPVLYAYCTNLKRPLDTIHTGIIAVTLEDIRWHRCDLKTLNLIPNSIAKQSAKDRGAGEAIMHREGRITECSASNFMIVRGDAIYTHPADNWILHGITRSVVFKLAASLSIPIIEQPILISQLSETDEAFATGTTVEITPIIEIDGQSVGTGSPGPITRRLQAAFERIISQ